MQGAIVRVCMVVAAAILNHPLLSPQENATLPAEQDQELIARMKEHEKKLEKEQARLEAELALLDSKQQQQEQETDSDSDYGWYFWSTVSMVIFFTIEVCRVDLADTEHWPVDDEDGPGGSSGSSSRTLVLDKGVLSGFCDRCVHAVAHENWRVREFVEGFADDLLESMRSVCNRESDMEVGDFVGVGSMFESWKVSKPLTCDLVVPFSPPEPHSFQFQLWCSPSGDAMPPDMHGYGRVTVTTARPGESEAGVCVCGSVDLGEDVLCLLHSKTTSDRSRATHSPEELLCSKNTSYLAKDQVMKWFQISVTKAWARISHKYEFELAFRNLDAAGALKIRFRSGKVVVMNIIPAVQLDDTDVYFVSHFPSDSSGGGGGSPDPYWPLSFAVYERNLLKHVAKSLPENSCHLHCLQVVAFLHRKQTGLTGKSALTNYHVKTAVLHLLLTEKPPSHWAVENMEHRLRDVLGFLQRSLQEKRLHHALVGNRHLPAEVRVPEAFRTAEPVNLFRSLVLRSESYAHAVRHLQEMLRNAPALLQEYTPPSPNGDAFHRLHQRLSA